MKKITHEDYLKNSITLHSPSFDEVEKIADQMDPAGILQISSSFFDLGKYLNVLEKSAFFAISVEPQENFARGLQIRAFWDREISCCNRGKRVYYQGGALAVMDDNGHLLLGEIEVCEKVARRYSLPVYGDLVVVSQRKKDSRRNLCCGNIGKKKISALSDILKNGIQRPPMPPVLLYPGPFKFLILEDGSLITRGEPFCTSEKFSKELIQRDSCFVLPSFTTEKANQPPYFVEKIQELGSPFLIRPSQISPVFPLNFSPEILREIPKKIRQKLLRVIRHREECFVLTGSDGREPHGCCPSSEVEGANLLVEGGILEVLHNHTSSPGSCPTHVYAFAGEIKKEEFPPVFQIHWALRARVEEALNAQK